MDYNMGKLPPKRSLSVDAWGFYNGASPMTASLKISPSIYWSESIKPSSKTSLFKEGMDRSFNEALCKIGTLRTITYPTGGTTTFEYEGHRFETLPMMPPLREGTLNLVDNGMPPVAPGAPVLMYIGELLKWTMPIPRLSSAEDMTNLIPVNILLRRLLTQHNSKRKRVMVIEPCSLLPIMM